MYLAQVADVAYAMTEHVLLVRCLRYAPHCTMLSNDDDDDDGHFVRRRPPQWGTAD